MKGTETEIQQVKELYADHAELPYISPERDLNQWLSKITLGNETIVPKRNMIRTEQGLLPGDIILLWRIQLGTFTNETRDKWLPKYFEYDYGINAYQRVFDLTEAGYTYEESAMQSLGHSTAGTLKNLLKRKGVKGYSKLKKAELMKAVQEQYIEEELAEDIEVRGYKLTDKGEQAIANNPAVLDKHPKKNL